MTRVTEPHFAPSANTPSPFPTATELPRRRSVLLVEPQPGIIAAVHAALDPTTHKIEAIADASAALALVEDRAFDAVLLSLGMPEGVRTLIALKRNTDLPVIALVGGRDYFQLCYQLRMAIAVGANGAVRKPLSPERLRVALDLALRPLAPATNPLSQLVQAALRVQV